MKFLVDEDVAIEVARCLQKAGHEAQLVAAVLGVQTDDVEIWQHASRTDAIVVTCNRQDFLELAGSAPATGLIVLNRRRTRQAECRHILDLIARSGESGLRNNVNFA
jgi:predicted nuclease of predicted toxin-antitoxin system